MTDINVGATVHSLAPDTRHGRQSRHTTLIDPTVMNSIEKPAQPRNPLHGLTLEMIVTELADHYSWQELGSLIPIRCFTHDPSIGSSLKFLRRTPWARDKVESLYLFMLREIKRENRATD
jgi:uncharacterized protein (DUF2132 family)